MIKGDFDQAKYERNTALICLCIYIAGLIFCILMAVGCVK